MLRVNLWWLPVFLLVEWAGVFKGQLIFYYGGIRTEVCLNGKIDLLVASKEENKREKMWAVLPCMSLL